MRAPYPLGRLGPHSLGIARAAAASGAGRKGRTPVVLAALLLVGPLAFCGLLGATAWADGFDPTLLDQALIGGNVLGNATGAIGVNEAAGDANAQANVGVVKLGPGSNSAARVIVIQNITYQGPLPGTTQATINGNAFSGVAGVLQVNQTSGAANASANLFSIGPDDGTALSPIMLSQVVSRTPTAGPSAGSTTNDVSVAQTAFSGASGLIQTTQIAGSGNSAANSFALRIGPGINP